MAVKDWNKTMWSGWSNYKKRQLLRVNFLNGWEVYIIQNTKDPLSMKTTEILNKKFKSESQALKFAKSYMRSH